MYMLVVGIHNNITSNMAKLVLFHCPVTLVVQGTLI